MNVDLPTVGITITLIVFVVGVCFVSYRVGYGNGLKEKKK